MSFHFKLQDIFLFSGGDKCCVLLLTWKCVNFYLTSKGQLCEIQDSQLKVIFFNTQFFPSITKEGRKGKRKYGEMEGRKTGKVNLSTLNTVIVNKPTVFQHSVFAELSADNYWDPLYVTSQILVAGFNVFSLPLPYTHLILMSWVISLTLSQQEFIELLRYLYSCLSSNLGCFQPLFFHIYSASISVFSFWKTYSARTHMLDGNVHRFLLGSFCFSSIFVPQI